MSEDPNIRIGKQGRKFKNTRYLETDTVGGDSCFWVPETARKLTDGYFTKNGYYVPKKYGFDTLEVHVSKTVTDKDGIDWTIDYDPIKYPDINPESITTIIDDLDLDITDIDIDDLDDILDEFGIDIDIGDLQDIIIDLGIDPDNIDIDDIIQIIDYIQDIEDIDIDDIDIDDINDIMDDLGIDPDNIGPGDVQDILDGLGIDVPIDDLQDIMDGLGIDPDNIEPDDIVDLLPYVDGDEYDPSDPFDPDNPPDPEVPVYPGNPDDPGFDPDSFDPDTFDPDTFNPDDFFPDQFYPDIYDPDPFDPDKYYPDGYDPEDYDPEIYDPDPDGIGPDPIPDYDGFDDEDPIDDGVPQVPDIGIPDGDIECPFDPETGLPDPMHDGEPIAPDAWDKFPGTLPDGEWDFSFDPPANLDDPDFDPTDIPWEMSFPGADGLPEGWTFDPKTGEWSLMELPDEIRIMHVPNKTTYKDREEIDLDGIVVQAYRGGEVWEDEAKKYRNGYIPAHELKYDPKFALYSEDGEYNGHISGNDLWVGNVYVGGPINFTERNGTVNDYHSEDFWHVLGTMPIATVFRSKYGSGDWGIFSNDAENPYRVTHLGDGVFLASRRAPGPCAEKATNIGVSTWSSTGGGTIFAYQDKAVYYQIFSYYREWFTGSLINSSSIAASYGASAGAAAWAMWNNADIKYDRSSTVTVKWTRPKDNKILEATFDIAVEQGNGHWGGTTPSGEYGGSHHSGKF